MIQIINRKRYDTKKAELIGLWNNGHCTGDAHYYSESLYVTIKGNFFIHKAGGALSDWAEKINNISSPFEKIIPINKEQALDWLSRNNCPEVAEKYFHDLIEDA